MGHSKPILKALRFLAGGFPGAAPTESISLCPMEGALYQIVAAIADQANVSFLLASCEPSIWTFLFISDSINFFPYRLIGWLPYCPGPPIFQCPSPMACLFPILPLILYHPFRPAFCFPPNFRLQDRLGQDRVLLPEGWVR